MLLAIVAVHAITRPRGIHLTRAELLVTPTTGYQLPSGDGRSRRDTGRVAGRNPAARPARWRMAPAAGSDATTVSWYHVRIPSPEAGTGELYLYIPRWKSDGTLAIYVDGRLSYQSHANLQWNGSNMPLWIAFDHTAEARRRATC